MDNNKFNNQHRNNNDPRFKDPKRFHGLTAGIQSNPVGNEKPFVNRDLSENLEVVHEETEAIDLNGVLDTTPDNFVKSPETFNEFTSAPAEVSEPATFKGLDFANKEDLTFVVVSNCKKVNFRSSKTKQEDNILYEAVAGTKFVLLDEEDEWSYVQELNTSKFLTGYIMKEFTDRISK
ncbi:MAG: hypothetical protein US15_C0056G0004 [Candidatus Moranbacteria bacterium GW2011_GWF1_36_4]|nr:MAG: hypothetical protein US15_C0056G0004 [Candidatus Moranbacteria bacterium GW2011_GWF1_36_4]HAQ02993.1 hypothetical protein [Candidatus Nomurabacteria bacterium]